MQLREYKKLHTDLWRRGSDYDGPSKQETALSSPKSRRSGSKHGNLIQIMSLPLLFTMISRFRLFIQSPFFSQQQYYRFLKAVSLKYYCNATNFSPSIILGVVAEAELISRFHCGTFQRNSSGGICD